MVPHIIKLVEKLTARVEAATESCDELTEQMVWNIHGTVVWKAKSFSGSPVFYPVYKYGEFYSYSMLALILKKGFLRLNQRAVKAAERPDFLCQTGLETIDRDIVRIGHAHRCEFKIQDADMYAWRIATALKHDIAAIEEKHSDFKNIVLCGGKDSLNLLLLPWKNPTVAASAPPNFELVKEFVRVNQLDYEVICLQDLYDKEVLEHEVLEACCYVDLTQWKWGVHLRDIALKYANKIIFWEGLVAGVYTTNSWKIYMHPRRRFEQFARRIYKRLEKPLPFTINRAIGRLLHRSVIQATWDKAAKIGGSHMALIREITDCLALSAYHGPEMIKVWEEVDLGSAAQRDMRNLVGRYLHGKDVIYPMINPAPPPSKIRIGMSSPSKLIELLESGGIRIER